MFDKVLYRIEGDGPVTAVFTYRGSEYRHTSRTMWLNQIDGMPVGLLEFDDVRVQLHRRNNTIEATITAHGETVTITPE